MRSAPLDYPRSPDNYVILCRPPCEYRSVASLEFGQQLLYRLHGQKTTTLQQQKQKPKFIRVFKAYFPYFVSNQVDKKVIVFHNIEQNQIDKYKIYHNLQCKFNLLLMKSSSPWSCILVRLACISWHSVSAS